MNIELNIDELVISGVQVRDPEHLRQAVAAELTQLLGQRGLPASLNRSGDIAAVDGGAIAPQPGAPAEALGGQIARAVYGGLGGE